MPTITRKPRARQDLKDIWRYVLEKSRDPDTADRYLDRIERKFDLLAQHPRMGQPRDELHQGLRSFPIGRYLIFYLPLKNGIGIVRVLYGGRDLEAIDFADDEDEE